MFHKVLQDAGNVSVFTAHSQQPKVKELHYFCEIWGSQGGENDDDVVLGYDAM
jgi:hypothetical protein